MQPPGEISHLDAKDNGRHRGFLLPKQKEITLTTQSDRALARQKLADAKIAEWIERALATAPPLTYEQRTRLAELLRPARDAIAAERRAKALGSGGDHDADIGERHSKIKPPHVEIPTAERAPASAADNQAGCAADK